MQCRLLTLFEVSHLFSKNLFDERVQWVQHPSGFYWNGKQVQIWNARRWLVRFGPLFLVLFMLGCIKRWVYETAKTMDIPVLKYRTCTWHIMHLMTKTLFKQLGIGEASGPWSPGWTPSTPRAREWSLTIGQGLSVRIYVRRCNAYRIRSSHLKKWCELIYKQTLSLYP